MTVIAIDGGGTTLRVARVADPLNSFDSHRMDTPPTTEGLADAIVAAVAAEGGADGIGIGLAGFVDHDSGWLRWSPHIKGGPVDIAGRVASATGVATSVDNDANLATLAEATHGAGRGHRMVLGVTVGTGIGGGLVIDGRIERGRGFLGEIGHIQRGVGTTCGCGREGCWESVASGTALDRAARRIVESDPRGALSKAVGDREPTGIDLVTAARSGNPESQAGFAGVATELGRGLADLVAIFDPDIIVLGGGVGALGEMLLEIVRPAMMEATVGQAHRRVTPVVTAEFGPRAGLVGAAISAGGMA